MPRAISLATQPTIRIAVRTRFIRRLIGYLLVLTRDLHRYAGESQKLAKPAHDRASREASWEGPL